jgi:hypothetical protein
MVCPACGGDARFKGYDSKTVTGLVGSLEYRRAYYHCDACHHGWHPTDAELPLETSRTRGAQEVIALAGVQEAFAECAERVLHRLSGLVVSASTVQRVTEAAGQTVAERRAADEPIGSAEAWNWPKDAEGRKIAYVSLDATGVPQQGAHGERTEGRMAWVGSVFAPVPLEASAKPRLRHVRYVSGLMSLEAIGRQLRRECQQVGVERAEVTICLTDGGNGLEACLAETVLAGLSQQTVTILDFYHCAERLSEFVALWVGPERAETESAAWRHRLKHEGGAAILHELEALDLARASPAVCEAHRQLCGYPRSNQHRTDYPTYQACGWEIGSGEIESACKTIVGQHLKCDGMRWRPAGTTAVCQLRALFKSDRSLWDHQWHPQTTA